VIALSVGCLYVVVVEASVALTRLFFSSTVPVLGVVLLVLACGGILAVWSTVGAARREVGQLRDQLLADSEPAAEMRSALVETTGRLAQQVGVPSPTLRVTDTDRPESFTLGTGSEAVVVVSTGLCEALTEAELTAVLAHEVSHLANADSRLMDVVLVPVLMADELIDDDPHDFRDEFWNLWVRLLKLYGQFGVAILSRGREWSADAGAVALTGSPAALASALSTLSEQRQTPSTDLRDWEQSVGALDILPPSDREHATGPFRTHPSTEKRIDRLRQQVVDAERASS
jgi:heat shock protein HtpX